MANPPLTSTPAADDPATTDRVYTNRGVCFSELPKAPKPQLKAGAARDISKLAEAHCRNQIQSQPLISVTSTSSTVTPGVSNANVSNANMNESLAAIMSSMERISASMISLTCEFRNLMGHHKTTQRFARGSSN